MRNLLSMLLVFSFLFTIGCDDDEATDETNPLVGVYNMVSYSVSGDGMNITQEADANNSLVLVLSEGGTYSVQGSIDGESNSESGTWSTTGSTLTLIYEDDEEENRIYEPITYGTVNLMFEEPENVKKVYAEEHGCFHTLKKLSAHTYEKTSHKGKTSIYKYKDGALVEAEIDAGLISFEIVAR